MDLKLSSHLLDLVDLKLWSHLPSHRVFGVRVARSLRLEFSSSLADTSTCSLSGLGRDCRLRHLDVVRIRFRGWWLCSSSGPGQSLAARSRRWRRLYSAPSRRSGSTESPQPSRLPPPAAIPVYPQRRSDRIGTTSRCRRHQSRPRTLRLHVDVPEGKTKTPTGANEQPSRRKHDGTGQQPERRRNCILNYLKQPYGLALPTPSHPEREIRFLRNQE